MLVPGSFINNRIVDSSVAAKVEREVFAKPMGGTAAVASKGAGRSPMMKN